MNEKYDAVEAFREEVKRFQATNKFNALTVTNFYIQGAVVLYEVDRLRTENTRLKGEVEKEKKRADDAEKARDALAHFLGEANDRADIADAASQQKDLGLARKDSALRITHDRIVKIFGGNHVARYRAKTISNWHGDKNLDCKKQARKVEASCLLVHRRIKHALKPCEESLAPEGK